MTTASGGWIQVARDQYASITHCLIVGPEGLDPSYNDCVRSITRPCLGSPVDYNPFAVEEVP